MQEEAIPFRVTLARFARSIRDFAGSDVGGKAKAIFAILVTLLVAVTGLNVVNSYVGRNFMTAIASRDSSAFVVQAFLYVGVFVASTVVAVIARFAEERLGLLWRDSLTRRALALYLAKSAYYRLGVSGDLANPDQRISEDIRAFTVTTISFFLMTLNSLFAIVAFSGVLWSISPTLFILTVLYAAFGSFITLVLGRPLVRLNYDQLDREAGFRSALIHVRENAEGIRFAQAEGVLSKRLNDRLAAVIANFRRITTINRNVGFFSTGYNWLIQIIPALVIAPSFIRGEVEFGVITQSAMAFSTLVAAFSLVVTQFQSLSAFAAVVARLSGLVEAIERAESADASDLRIEAAPGGLSFEQVSLYSNAGATLLKDLSVSIPAGIRVLIKAPNRAALSALFRATAGGAVQGSGRILTPPAADISFLEEQPYLLSGPLRAALEGSQGRSDVSDDRIVALLKELGLERVLQSGGLDGEQDWKANLSQSERCLLAIARIVLLKPQFALLDRIGAAIGEERAEQVLRKLSEQGISYVCFGDETLPPVPLDAVLMLQDDGGWTWSPKPLNSDASDSWRLPPTL